MHLKQISILGYIILFFSLFGLVLRRTLFAESAELIAVQICALFLMIWARMTFGRRSFHYAADPTEGGLVVTGPYRYIRHPIYASLLYFASAGILSHLSLIDSLLGLAAAAATAVRIYAEERLVVQQYPQYREYAARTKRIIPYLF